MPAYRDRLPQLDGGLFLTDGGLETTLLFHDGFDLPCFAAFDLLLEQGVLKKALAYFDLTQDQHDTLLNLDLEYNG